jgi:hypothetical protein
MFIVIGVKIAVVHRVLIIPTKRKVSYFDHILINYELKLIG